MIWCFQKLGTNTPFIVIFETLIGICSLQKLLALLWYIITYFYQGIFLTIVKTSCLIEEIFPIKMVSEDQILWRQQEVGHNGHLNINCELNYIYFIHNYPSLYGVVSQYASRFTLEITEEGFVPILNYSIRLGERIVPQAVLRMALGNQKLPKDICELEHFITLASLVTNHFCAHSLGILKY
jgi:hypothetical protein